MPPRDGTGPEGKGAKTGRKLGPCDKTNSDTVRPMRKGRGLGFGRGLRGRMRKIRLGLNRR